MENSKQRTILLVEDEPIVAMMETRFLEKDGYAVRLAQSGEEAVEAIASGTPVDLAILDIDLGEGMDGTEAARKILALRELPILFLSSHTEPEIVKKTEEISSYGYVVKNAGETVLLASVRMAFRLYEAHKKIRESEGRLQATLDSIGDGVISTDTQGRVVGMNGVAELLTGWKLEEARGLPIQEVFRIVNAETGSAVENPVFKSLAQGIIVGLANHTVLISRNLKEYQIADSCAPIRAGGSDAFGAVLVFRDVTEEHRRQEEILSTANRLGERNKELGCLYAFSRLTDRPDMSIPKLCEELLELLPAAMQYPEKAVAEILLEGARWTTGAFGNAPGNISADIIVEGKAIGSLAVEYADPGTDPHADQFLPEEQELLRTIADLLGRSANRSRLQERIISADSILSRSPAVGFRWANEPGWPVRFVTENVSALTGWAGEDFLNGTIKYTDLIHPEDMERVLQEVAAASRNSGTEYFIHIPYRILRKEGCARWVEDMTTLSRDEHGAVLSYQGILIDITEKVEKDRDLAFQARLLDEIGQAVIVTDPEGTVSYCNRAVQGLYGWGKSEILGKNILDVTLAEQSGEEAAAIMGRLRAGKSWSGDIIVRRRDGSKFPAFVHDTPVFDDSGALSSIIGVSSDISRRKRLEESLRLEALWNETILEGISDAFFALDEELRVTYFNTHAEEFLGKKRGEVFGKNLFDAFPEARGSIFQEEYTKALREKTFRSFETHFDVPPLVNWYNVRVHPMEKGILVFFQLVTERKLSEQKILDLLKEKDIILKEAHHRIKNNMNILASLLSIQEETLEDEGLKRILQDAIGRIQSMRVLYEKLYQKDDARTLSAKTYFEDLLPEIMAIFSQGQKIRISLAVEDIPMDVKPLTVLGIIVNELVTNSIKYAFPSGAGGTISLGIGSENGEAPHRLTLRYEDDGVGMDEHREPDKPTGLGIHLVSMLVEQLHGSMKLEGEGKNRYTITFSV